MPSPEGVYIGIDGGGTKTSFVATDRAGALIARHVEPTAYHIQIGLEGLSQRLRDGVTALLSAAGLDAASVDFAFAGLPAYGEDSAIQPMLDAAPEMAFGHRRYRCGNDMICGWAGALAGADGIGITAGTGSIGYGERGGRTARAGGWGELFSDEGSAHWIARRMLTLFTRMSDGRLPRGPLHAIVRENFALGDDLDLCARILSDEGAASRDQIAALSVLATRAAEHGDAAVLTLFEQAAGELADIAAAIRTALGYQPAEEVPLSYSGGAFKAGALLLTPFEAALAARDPGFRLRTPLFDPGIGAALYARRLHLEARAPEGCRFP